VSRPKNDTYLRALLREPTPYTPVWIMRQAGRYLPEYNQTRARAGDFLSLCRSPDLATEVTLQPLARFPLDAAILFSDILTIPDAMGLGLYFVEGEGPKFERPVRTAPDIARLGVPDMESDLRYVMDAVRMVRRELDGSVSLIGFSGSPWTLACYMVEGGGSSDDWRGVKSMLYARPDLMHRILSVNAEAVTGYLNAQIDAGAQAVMVFDSWGGALADGGVVPRIVFTKGGGLWLEQMGALDCDVLGLDWTVNLGRARALVGARKALQGNLDPAVLFAPPGRVAEEARRVLDDFGAPHTGNGTGPTHIFNLGHGISQHTPPEHVQVLVEAVHAHSAHMRGALPKS
jgi:uroporphyrinogen decarboxylase